MQECFIFVLYSKQRGLRIEVIQIYYTVQKVEFFLTREVNRDDGIEEVRGERFSQIGFEDYRSFMRRVTSHQRIKMQYYDIT